MAERSKAPDSRDRPFSNQSILVLEWGRGFESHFWQKLFILFSKVYQNIKFGMKYTCYIYIFKKSMKVIKNLILGGSVSRINEFLHSKKHRSCAQIDVSYFLFYLPKEFIVIFVLTKNWKKKTLESSQYAKHVRI